MKEMKCLRCNGKMIFKGQERIDTQEWGTPSILQRILEDQEVMFFVCAGCGKLEFYLETPATLQVESSPQRAQIFPGEKAEADYMRKRQ